MRTRSLERRCGWMTSSCVDEELPLLAGLPSCLQLRNKRERERGEGSRHAERSTSSARKNRFCFRQLLSLTRTAQKDP